jgi:cytochrome P450
MNIPRNCLKLCSSAARAELTATGPRQQGDLLQALLIARDDGGGGMADAAVRDEAMTLLIAGQETSAIVLGWTCALLAQQPDVQHRAADEVASRLQARTACTCSLLHEVRNGAMPAAQRCYRHCRHRPAALTSKCPVGAPTRSCSLLPVRLATRLYHLHDFTLSHLTAPQGRAPVAADCSHLPYLESVILEAMRLYPPVRVCNCAVHPEFPEHWMLCA